MYILKKIYVNFFIDGFHKVNSVITVGLNIESLILNSRVVKSSEL